LQWGDQQNKKNLGSGLTTTRNGDQFKMYLLVQVFNCKAYIDQSLGATVKNLDEIST
jgi:hypothetical protein